MVSEINQNMLKREKTLRYFKIYVKNMLKNQTDIQECTKNGKFKTVKCYIRSHEIKHKIY